MPKLHLVNNPNKALPISVEKPSIETSKYVTADQLDNSMNNIVERLAKKIEPESALTPEVRGMVKAVGEVQSLREALKDPTSAGIEEATSNLVTQVLTSSLQNITGGGQQAVQAEPLKNTLAKIVVNNLSGENSPLPQLMDALTNVLGKEKVVAGYDAGIQYIDQQQKQNNLPATVLQFDENNQEDIVAYAQQMGYSDVQYAQAKLIEHKKRLNKEIEEYQRVQGGGQQSVAAEEPVVQQEPIVQQEHIVQQEPIVRQEQYSQAEYDQVEYEKDHVDPKYSESLEPIVDKIIYEEEPIDTSYLNEKLVVEEVIIDESIIKEPIVEEPVLKVNKVIVLHGKPRKLTLVKDKVEQTVSSNNYEVEVDKTLNIDVTYNEGNKSLDNESLDNDVNDILNEIGE